MERKQNISSLFIFLNKLNDDCDDEVSKSPLGRRQEYIYIYISLVKNFERQEGDPSPIIYCWERLQIGSIIYIRKKKGRKEESGWGKAHIPKN